MDWLLYGFIDQEYPADYSGHILDFVSGWSGNVGGSGGSTSAPFKPIMFIY
jgi:hypothetical protein